MSVRWTIPAEEFTEAVTRFDRELMVAMADRVRRIEAGATLPGSEIDVAALRRDHRMRASWLKGIESRVRTTERTAVRSGICLLMA